MKRLLTRLLCLGMAVVCLTLFSACGSDSKQTPYELTQKILELCSEDIEMTELTAEQTATYYGIPTSHLHDFSVYISSADDRYDTVAVFAYADREERTVFAAAVADSIKTNETTVKAVNNTEYMKLQNRIFMELEDKLILVISDNNAEIEEMLKDLGATKFNA